MAACTVIRVSLASASTSSADVCSVHQFEKARKCGLGRALTKLTHGTDELAKVLHATLRFRGVLILERLHVPARDQYFVAELVQRQRLRLRTERLDQLPKRHYLGRGRPLDRRILLDVLERLPDAGAGLGRVVQQAVDRGLSDSPSGRVDHAQQADVVVGVMNDAKVSHRIFDLRPVVKPHASDHAIRQVGGAECFLENTRLRVSSIKRHHVFETASVGLGALHHPDEELRLVPLVFVANNTDFGTVVVFGPKSLGLTIDVTRDDRVGDAQNAPGRPIVLLELDHLGARKLPAKIENVAAVGPSPTIDALVVVSHHAEVLMLRDQGSDQAILSVVGILKFVDEDLFKPSRDGPTHRVVAFQSSHHAVDQIAEIEGAGFGHALLIGGIDPLDHFQPRVPVDGKLLRRDDFLFRAIDLGRDRAHRIPLFLEAEVAEDPRQHRALVDVIVDGEVAPDAHLFVVAPQEARTGGVKRPDPKVPGSPVGNEAAESLAHFTGRFVGERDAENAPRRNAELGHEPSYPEGDDPSFSAPRPGKHHERSGVVEHRFSLGGVQ